MAVVRLPLLFLADEHTNLHCSIMVYRPNNWVGSGNIKSNQIIAAKQMGANAIYVQTPVKTELIQPISPPRDYTDNNKFNHDLIPKWFFENYGGKL